MALFLESRDLQITDLILERFSLVLEWGSRLVRHRAKRGNAVSQDFFACSFGEEFFFGGH